MAGSVTATLSQVSPGVTKASLAWLSDAAGAVSGNAVSLPASELLQVEFIPDATDVPTAAYDVTGLTGPGGSNVIGASIGANLSETTATIAVPAVSTYFRPILEAGSYTLAISAAGNAKRGRVVLLLRLI